MITFTIEGTEYQAEEGMTWGEWCNSTYNTGGFQAWGVGFILTQDVQQIASIENPSEPIRLEWVIEASADYVVCVEDEF